MISARNVVCLASNWFDHPTGKHHLMRILAERNQVLWVNYHASRAPRLNRRDTGTVARRLRQVLAGPRRVAPGLSVLAPPLLPLPGSRPVRLFNARLLAGRLRAALARWPRRPTQLWLFTPDAPELVGLLPVERVVYYCVDEFAAFSGCDASLLERLERATLAASDVVLAASAELYRRCRRVHANVHLVRHGVDYDHFAAAPRLGPDQVPEDVRALPGPLFGYFGLIGDYVDLELLATAARCRPEWSFVLIGRACCPLEPLRGLANVRVLGSRPYEQLPRYCRAFDVGLIPFRVNRLTRAANPIKLREYLAAGLPVVSAPLPEVLEYRSAVQTAEGPAEFLAACSAALTLARRTDPRTRQALVRHESWRARAALLARIVSTPAPAPPASARRSG